MVAKKEHSLGGVIATAVGVVGVSAVLAAGVFMGPSLAIADGSGASVTTFGVGKTTTSTTTAIGALPAEAIVDSNSGAQPSVSVSDTSVLTSSVNYDVMIGVYQIEEERRAIREAAEAAARAEEQRCMDQAEKAKAAWEAKGGVEATGLDDVDWTVGKDAFIEEWTVRIDEYLSGTPMAGCGQAFAKAAWDYGVDPRWSPAISHTESGVGNACFLPHNAWGWGSSSWSTWEDAIRAHVAGLAKGYGYSITYGAASTYCPPNTSHWFNNTLSQMKRI